MPNDGPCPAGLGKSSCPKNKCGGLQIYLCLLARANERDQAGRSTWLTATGDHERLFGVEMLRAFSSGWDTQLLQQRMHLLGARRWP